MGSEPPALAIPETSGGSVGKKKVALKPGRSLMDWIRFTRSGEDLTSSGEKCLQITTNELSKHNSRTDAWISIKGKVYNITHYLEYHPGGEDELMRGAGKDATDLFNEVHQWVNVDSMLQKCFVGYLKKSWW
ncbi:cytochrome b5 reductase 4-like [Uloborus diversus]|uniref:cytochrome b5 reductase 4-like n=1 Tax=Uloborus diversus TaxID=327109 RepID=UPI00240A722F|nr:cytochrome b5 reductase 4-like [Uloborus diversus]